MLSSKTIRCLNSVKHRVNRATAAMALQAFASIAIRVSSRRALARSRMGSNSRTRSSSVNASSYYIRCFTGAEMLFLKDLRDGAIGGIQFNFDGFDLNQIIFFAHRLDRLPPNFLSG